VITSSVDPSGARLRAAPTPDAEWKVTELRLIQFEEPDLISIGIPLLSSLKSLTRFASIVTPALLEPSQERRRETPAMAASENASAAAVVGPAMPTSRPVIAVAFR
jgi:hypothetical protein